MASLNSCNITLSIVPNAQISYSWEQNLRHTDQCTPYLVDLTPDKGTGKGLDQTGNVWGKGVKILIARDLVNLHQNALQNLKDIKNMV